METNTTPSLNDSVDVTTPKIVVAKTRSGKWKAIVLYESIFWPKGNVSYLTIKGQPKSGSTLENAQLIATSSFRTIREVKNFITNRRGNYLPRFKIPRLSMIEIQITPIRVMPIATPISGPTIVDPSPIANPSSVKLISVPSISNEELASMLAKRREAMVMINEIDSRLGLSMTH